MARVTSKNLRAQAHSLKPIVSLGKKGLTPEVLQELDRALYDHELIKVKLSSLEKSERTELIEQMCTHLDSRCVLHIGKIAALYRLSTKKAQ